MEIISVTKGRSVKNVIIANATGHDDGELFRFACEAAGETSHSLFGWRVTRTGDNARVRLDTD